MVAGPVSSGRRVHYVFMQFPAPSEAFARVELRGLRDAGCGISASTMRAPRRGHRGLLREHGLDDMPVSYAGPVKWLKGAAVLFMYPFQVWRVCREILPALVTRRFEMAVTCALLPRAFGIAAEIRKMEVDHVHIFWGHYPSLVGLVLKTFDADCSVSMSLGAYDLVRQSPVSRLLASRVTVLTHANVNVQPISDFTGIPPESVAVVYRGIEVSESPAPTIRSASPHVIIVERLVPEKRTLDAISAFASAKERLPDAVLTILGDGPSRADLERSVHHLGIQGSVKFAGRVSHDVVHEEMGHAHVILSMSQSPGERLPNAVKEAMCRGCAVVVARSPGIEELVQHGVTGYVVGPGETDYAADHLVELLENVQRAAELGKIGRLAVIQRFDITATTRLRMACWFSNEKTGSWAR